MFLIVREVYILLSLMLEIGVVLELVMGWMVKLGEFRFFFLCLFFVLEVNFMFVVCFFCFCFLVFYLEV